MKKKMVTNQSPATTLATKISWHDRWLKFCFDYIKNSILCWVLITGGIQANLKLKYGIPTGIVVIGMFSLGFADLLWNLYYAVIHIEKTQRTLNYSFKILFLYSLIAWLILLGVFVISAVSALLTLKN
jgi:hypothetical protein